MNAAHRSEDGVYHSSFSELPRVEPGTLYDYVYGKRCQTEGRRGAEERISLSDYATKRTWTKRQAREEVNRLAATLLSRYDCKVGDHVLICYPTSATFALLCYACARAGLIMALANPAYTSDEMRHTTQLVGARLILTNEQLKSAFDSSSGKLVDASDKGDLQKGKVASLDEAHRILARAGANDVQWTSPCGIFFSSGTTGLPKAVVTSHRNLIMLVHSLQCVPGYATPDSWNKGWPSDSVCFLPGFHIAGLAGLVITGVEGGEVSFAVSSPMDLPMIVRAIRQVRPYRAAIVPPLLLALTRLGLAGPQGLQDCMHGLFSAAAPLGRGLQEEAQAKLQITVGQMWGLSESTGAVVCSDLTKDTRAGSCGQVMSGMTMRIINEDGTPVKHNEPGEILMRGPLIFRGYLNNEKATQETLDDKGWLHTGDIGYMDDDGFLFVVDRRKELIKYKGFQVAPAELEALLLGHPAVMDVGVTGVVEKEEVGEVPRAFVVLRPDKKGDALLYTPGGAQPCKPDVGQTAKDIQAYVAGRVANYKQLRGGVVFVAEVPKNPSGKILRRLLRDMSKPGGGTTARL